MSLTGGLGLVSSAEKLATANKLLSAGFAAQAIGSMYEHSEAFKKAYDENDSNEALYQLTHGVLSVAVGTMAATHAAEADLPLTSQADVAAGKAVGAAVNKVGGAAGKAIDALRAPFSGDSLEDLYKKLSNPSKTQVAKGFKDKIEMAIPALKEVIDQNPDVDSPQKMSDAINQYRSTTDARILSRAEDLRGQPESQMTGIEGQVRSALDNAFKDQEGRYTQEEQESAEQSVMKHLLQLKDDGINPPTQAEPDLFQAENIRQRFNQDIAPSFDAKAPEVAPATRFVKQIATDVLRSAIDGKYDQLGIGGVKEWRQQEAALINVRDQIAKAQALAEKRGQFSLFNNFLSQLKWHALLPAMLGSEVGGLHGLFYGGTGGALLGMFSDWMADRRTNPNTLLERIVKKTIQDNEKNPPGGVTPTFGEAAPKAPSVVGKVAKQAIAPVAVQAGQAVTEDNSFRTGTE